MTAKSFVTSDGQPLPEGAWSWHGGKGAMIWQLMFADGGLLLGLKRFPEQRRASLFCLSSETGQVFCDDFVLAGGGDSSEPVGDGWMIGLETTHRNLLFCHGFQSGSPEHQGIWAVDLSIGTLVWSRPDFAFAANLGETFLAYKSRVFAGFPERDYYLIDPFTGREVEHIGTDPERFNQLRNEAIGEEDRQGVMLPSAGMDESGHVETIELAGSSVTATHRLACDGGTESAWSSVLAFNAGERLLYKDAMGKAEAVPLFNNFLVKDQRLYYIKEREVLVSIDLS
ncbi:MAG TPA: hypothetical protein ENL07_04410 [Chlorobaculum parvum]|uniref:DUF4905 domain-containing protein n=1 Tax=Chlorobaculum parvum TaxID=274539 RepID=A0A7C5DG92_9CHLB|nr:hypothetical protein [Chlorobaculum parvum]